MRSEAMVGRILTDNDTANLQVIYGLRPDLIADLESLPAARECGLQQWPNVSNGKENITMS
jgi:hypothetical protein